MFPLGLGGVAPPHGKKNSQGSWPIALNQLRLLEWGNPILRSFSTLPSRNSFLPHGPVSLLTLVWLLWGVCSLVTYCQRWALSKLVLCKKFSTFFNLWLAWLLNNLSRARRHMDQCRGPLCFILGWFTGQRLEFGRPSVDEAEGFAQKGAGIDGLRCPKLF